MKPYARSFYKSKAWSNCRNAYAKSVGGLCEICLRNGIYTPGEIVHHKIHISKENINDPNVTLSWGNLELVCRDCHAKLHDYEKKRRFSIDDEGNVIIHTPPYDA